MSVYDNLINTAKRMIDEKGQYVTWRTLKNPQSPAPEKPWDITEPLVEEEFEVKIVFLPNDRYGREVFRYFANSDIPVGNLIGYMAQVDFTPSLKDVVIRDNVELSILSINEYNPNGEGFIVYIIEFDGVKSV